MRRVAALPLVLLLLGLPLAQAGTLPTLPEAAPAAGACIVLYPSFPYVYIDWYECQHAADPVVELLLETAGDVACIFSTGDIIHCLVDTET